MTFIKIVVNLQDFRDKFKIMEQTCDLIIKIV
jgi:hypothetical protein